jgi:hypothetical protein
MRCSPGFAAGGAGVIGFFGCALPGAALVGTSFSRTIIWRSFRPLSVERSQRLISFSMSDLEGVRTLYR